MIIVGIDPGLSGGVVALSEFGNVIFNRPMPTIHNGKRNFINAGILVNYLEELHPDIIATEKVSARPGQGVTSMFSFGYGAGIIEGIATAMKVKFITVRPQTWMKEVLKDMPKEDKASTIFATRMEPKIDWRATERCKKIHDGMTDAYCIAIYTKRTYDV